MIADQYWINRDIAKRSVDFVNHKIAAESLDPKMLPQIQDVLDAVISCLWNQIPEPNEKKKLFAFEKIGIIGKTFKIEEDIVRQSVNRMERKGIKPGRIQEETYER